MRNSPHYRRANRRGYRSCGPLRADSRDQIHAYRAAARRVAVAADAELARARRARSASAIRCGHCRRSARGVHRCRAHENRSRADEPRRAAVRFLCASRALFRVSLQIVVG
ncbi:MAG: hypothetical protein KA144_11360 [Xanthomonadaceae bacterium]|nr:hypothetical protein [Xanthomonadaceae bacterium]